MSKTNVSKKSITLQDYGINEEMAKLIKICTHQRMAQYFLNNYNKHLISFPISKKNYDVFVWNNKYCYYKKIEDQQSIEQKIINLIVNTFEPIFDEVEYDYKIALTKTTKDDPSTFDYAKDLKDLSKNVKHIITFIETKNNSSSCFSYVLSSICLSGEDRNNFKNMDQYINFRNCKVNLKTGKISKRTQRDFVTNFIDFDYTNEPVEEVSTYIKTILKQICNNNDEDLEFMLSFIGYSITSETKEQKFLNLYGPLASNGKSTLIKIISSVFGNTYITKANRDMFNENFTKAHKFFAGMKETRLGFCEDMEKTKIKTDLIKDVVDGDKINNEVMYSTSELIEIKFKIWLITNHMLRFVSDKGMLRRLICFEFSSRFSDPEKYEEEKILYKDRNVFKKDKSLIKNFETNDDYKNAFAHLIIQYAIQYYSLGLNIPKKFIKASEALCDENDKMKQFINDHFEITNNDKDRIHKLEFHKMYIDYTGLKLIEWGLILSDLKSLNIKYDSDKLSMIYNGKSGCKGIVLGLKKKIQQQTEPEFNDNNGLDYGLDDEKEDNRSNLSKNDVEAIKTENLELKLRLDMMQREMDELKKLLNKPKQEINNTESTEDDDFDIDDLKALAEQQHSCSRFSSENEPPKIIAKSTAQDKKKQYINVKKN